MGGTLLSVGELDASRHHFEAALAAYDEAASAALGARLGPRRLRACLVRAHALAARRRARRGVARRAGHRARAAAGSHVQRDPRARLRRTPPPDAPRHRARARVRGSGCGAVRAVRIRLLRRLGPRPDRMGARAGASPPKASRSSSRRSSGSTATARRRDGRTTCRCSPRPTAGLGIGIARRRFWMRRSPWRSSEATCGGFRRCISRRASSSRRLSAKRRFGARSRWPARKTAAAWSSGFSPRRLPARCEKRRGPGTSGNRSCGGTLSRTFWERSGS